MPKFLACILVAHAYGSILFPFPDLVAALAMVPPPTLSLAELLQIAVEGV